MKKKAVYIDPEKHKKAKQFAISSGTSLERVIDAWLQFGLDRTTIPVPSNQKPLVSWRN
jgi:hypothetical protein